MVLNNELQLLAWSETSEIRMHKCKLSNSADHAIGFDDTQAGSAYTDLVADGCLAWLHFLQPFSSQACCSYLSLPSEYLVIFADQSNEDLDDLRMCTA